MAERKTQSGRSGSVNRKKTQRRRPVPGKYMIPQLLLLVFVVLAVFEGNVIYTLFTHRIGSKIEVVSDGGPADSSTTVTADSSGTGTVPAVDVTDSLQNGTTPDAGLAGLASTVVSSPVKEEEVVSDPYRISEEIDSPAVVKETAPPVDDSYFANAVFIGDSRMEGFRNASGITQGTFLTAIGLNSSDMGKQIISTSDGMISVYQGLSGRQYDRIYLMLGANDLGYYPWEDFQPAFENVLNQFHQLQPRATIYVCSVIYVDESRIAAGYEYDNNNNVRTINGYILSACEKLWFTCYLNLNEIFSNGYGALIPEASNDGIHLYPKYCEQMLAYLKSHYITDQAWAETLAAHGETGSASAPAPSAAAAASQEEETENTAAAAAAITVN